MRRIGAIVRLQVQRASLKVGQRPWQRYEPTPLLAVPALLLSEGGVNGLTDTGATVMDVHHRDHPASKHRGDNGILVGFTSHYAAMRARLGEHVTDGLAGENILVTSDRPVAAEELRDGLLIETADGWARLVAVQVAEPCAPFSRYILRGPADARTLSATLDFLRRGRRGFYSVYHGPPARLQLGDRVYAADARRLLERAATGERQPGADDA